MTHWHQHGEFAEFDEFDEFGLREGDTMPKVLLLDFS